jgi:hypothetical protein
MPCPGLEIPDIVSDATGVFGEKDRIIATLLRSRRRPNEGMGKLESARSP